MKIQIKLKLAKARKDRRKSQLWLSKKTGVARGYISELESGIYDNPGIKILSKIAIALCCTLEDLVEYGLEGD